MKGSWQPKLAAIFGALVALGSAAMSLMDKDPATNVDFPGLFATISIAIGLFRARQNDVSSQEVGVRPPVPGVDPVAPKATSVAK